jgi:hypothetical protein
MSPTMPARGHGTEALQRTLVRRRAFFRLFLSNEPKEITHAG